MGWAEQDADRLEAQAEEFANLREEVADLYGQVERLTAVETAHNALRAEMAAMVARCCAGGDGWCEAYGCGTLERLLAGEFRWTVPHPGKSGDNDAHA